MLYLFVMKSVAIVSSCLFITSLVGVFAFPDAIDVVDGRIYQLVTIIEKVSNRVSVGAAYEALEPSTKYVGVVEGSRREEIATSCQQKLGWDTTETQAFAGMLSCSTENDEGYFLPGVYLVDKDSTPRDIKLEMKTRFDDALRQKAIELGADPNRIDLDTVITVASLIQREAASSRDMGLISGIIWNRLAVGMPLQVDATLQYIKGKNGKWWPYVLSKDKYIDSPYNTYEYKGLPPTPISNPGIAAIGAALSPEKTECLFYLHDKYGRIHCSKTYEEHKAYVNKYLR